MEFKRVVINETTSLEIPAHLSPPREAELIAQLRVELDPETLEAECREILRQHANGELIPFEDVIAELKRG